MQVPAKLIRFNDYVPYGGFVKDIKESRTGGLFPKWYITLTFFTGDDYVDYTTEAHIPVDVERIYEQVAHSNKEKK